MNCSGYFFGRSVILPIDNAGMNTAKSCFSHSHFCYCLGVQDFPSLKMLERENSSKVCKTIMCWFYSLIFIVQPLSKFLECKSLKNISVALRHCQRTLLLPRILFFLISSNLRYSLEQISLFLGNTLNVKEQETQYISAIFLFLQK